MTAHSVLNVFMLHPSGVAQNRIKMQEMLHQTWNGLTRLQVTGPFILPLPFLSWKAAFKITT